MRQMQKVLWTKGTLLTPQHLQAQDRFLEDLVGFQLSSLAFFPWGFSRLEIDPEALGSFPTAPPSTSPAPTRSPRPSRWRAPGRRTPPSSTSISPSPSTALAAPTCRARAATRRRATAPR
jgi:hypothetical protein